MKVIKQHKCFGGIVRFNEHESRETKTKMNFSTFTPDGKVRGCLIWLSGLTCTDENFMAKAAAQGTLTKHGLMVVCPDTSPRGLQLPNEHESWDFGSGAGFYVDATTPGYRDHYRMYSYITQELFALVQSEFKVEDRISLSGHSMGGHGALVMGLREPQRFKSISAFSPIVNPTRCPWGEKAFSGYLGSDRANWSRYDACSLIQSGAAHGKEILIDQGTQDDFLEKQLLTNNLVEASKDSKQKLSVRYQDGYDHSYYFISTFIEDHIRFHSDRI